MDRPRARVLLAEPFTFGFSFIYAEGISIYELTFYAPAISLTLRYNREIIDIAVVVAAIFQNSWGIRCFVGIKRRLLGCIRWLSQGGIGIDFG